MGIYTVSKLLDFGGRTDEGQHIPVLRVGQDVAPQEDIGVRKHIRPPLTVFQSVLGAQNINKFILAIDFQEV